MVSINRTLRQRIGTQEKGEEAQPIAHLEIHYIAKELGLSERTVSLAEAIYNRSLAEKLIQNRTIGEVAAASVLAACRVDDFAYSPSEISASSEANETGIQRTYADLSRQLDLDTGLTDPLSFIPRFCSELELPDEVEATAKAMVEEGMEEGIHSGRSPSGIAAAGVYAAAKLCSTDESGALDPEFRRTQREVADVADLTVQTIRNRYIELVELLARNDSD